MGRFFTLPEAEKLLPEVERRLREALFLKSELSTLEEELKEFSRHVLLAGGVRVDHTKVLARRARRDDSIRRLQETVDNIHETGAQVKDLDIGLIDFPSLYQGEEVCLCWKLGEGATIDFWHGASEGFGGRKRIDREFRDSHHGGKS